MNSFREHKWSLGASSKYILTLSVAGRWPSTCAGKKNQRSLLISATSAHVLIQKKKEVRAFEGGFSPPLIFDLHNLNV